MILHLTFLHFALVQEQNVNLKVKVIVTLHRAI